MLPALLLAALAQAPPGAPGPNDLAAPDALHVAVVLDDSGSMLDPMPGSGDSKMNVAKAALRDTFAALPPDARVGVFGLNAYSNGANRELLSIAPHTPREVANVLDRLYPGGGTPLGDRIAEAADALLAERAARKYGDYRLLVITDGEATDPAQMSAAVPAALGAGLTIDVIGVAMADDHALATQVDRYRRADDPDALREALTEVLAESTGQSAPDGEDGGAESDYDLIAPLPDGAAPVALRALSNSETEASIGERAAAAGGGSFPDGGKAAPVPAQGPGNNGGGGGADLLCCCLPVLGAGLMVVFAFKLLAGNAQRRRRRW